jgi:hypothetical protein
MSDVWGCRCADGWRRLFSRTWWVLRRVRAAGGYEADPVSAGLSRPGHYGAQAQAERVAQDGDGYVGGEGDQGGVAGWSCRDARVHRGGRRAAAPMCRPAARRDLAVDAAGQAAGMLGCNGPVDLLAVIGRAGPGHLAACPTLLPARRRGHSARKVKCCRRTTGPVGAMLELRR